MSTKNLARSIVEGGKEKEFRARKKISQKRFRKEEKMFCKNFSEVEPSSNKKYWIGYYSAKEAYADKFNCFKRFMSKARKESSYEGVKSYLVRRYGNKSVKARHLMDHFELFVSKDDSFSIDYNFRGLAGIKNYW